MRRARASTITSAGSSPPDSRSSTVLWRSVAWSRGLAVPTFSRPRSTARPVTPNWSSAVTLSGNKVTTSMCIQPLEIRIPVHRDDPGVEVDTLDHLVLDERDEAFPFSFHHQHIVVAGGHQSIYLAEALPSGVADLESHEVGPVIL